MKETFMHKIRKQTAVIAVTAVLFQVLGVQSFLVMAKEDVPAAKNQQQTAVITTRNNNPVFVNGQRTASGAGIQSGAQIETYAGAEAEVQLTPGGTLKIFPKTRLVLTYSRDSVNVKVLEGCATLFAQPAINATLVTPTGEEQKANEASRTSELSFCDITGANPANNRAGMVRKGRGFLPPAAIVALIGGGALAIFLVTRPDKCEDAVSPFEPGCAPSPGLSG